MIFTINNVLDGRCDRAEFGYLHIKGLAKDNHEPTVLNLSSVNFVRPYGTLVLLNLVRMMRSYSDTPIAMTGLKPEVHAYLERANFFKICVDEGWIEPIGTSPGEKWTRSARSLTLLEISPIHVVADVLVVAAKAHRILEFCLGRAVFDLVSILSELCNNIWEHSGDVHGSIMIQAYRRRDETHVCVAVSDLGVGIERTLANRPFGARPTGTAALVAVLAGHTSRPGRGGSGLPTVLARATESGGHLWLRSGTSAVFADAAGYGRRSQLQNVPGTQVGVEFRSPSIQLPVVEDYPPEGLFCK